MKWKLAHTPKRITLAQVRRAIRDNIEGLGSSFAEADPARPRAARVVRDERWILEIAALQRALKLLPKRK